MQQTSTIPRIGPDFSTLFNIVDPDAIAAWIFYVIVALVVIYTLIAAYHWIRYGHRSLMTIPALAMHVAVSLGLIGFAISGLS